MKNCKECGSFSINENSHGRTAGEDLDLCDVCYWRKRAVTCVVSGMNTSEHALSGTALSDMQSIAAMADEYATVCRSIIDRLAQECISAQATIALMQPVIDAAKAFVLSPSWGGVSDEDVVLEKALKDGGFLK